MYIIEKYGIKSGTLLLDDSDIERSKNTTQIALLHKIKDKKTNGFINGQNIVFLILATKEITIPVGFQFYAPDPAKSKWSKEDQRLRKAKVKKKYRPSKPEANPEYPSKIKIALSLLKAFKENFPNIKIKSVAADCLYSCKEFIEGAAEHTEQKQVITQIKKTQLINVNGKNQKVGDFFANYSGKKISLDIRGKSKNITYCGGIFKIKSLEKRYRIIALKYEEEKEYRFLIAHDPSWLDIQYYRTICTTPG